MSVAKQATSVAMLALATSVLITGCVAIDPTLSLVSDAVPAAEAYAKRGQSTEQLSKFSGREEMWRAMWKSHLDAPWIGHGYFVSSRTGRMEVWNDVGNRTAHNMVLQVLVTCGRIGLLLFACGLLWPTFHVFGGLSGRFGDGRLLTFFALLLTWYLGWGLLNESIAGPVQPESIVFYSLLGIAVGVSGRRRKAANYWKGY
jgi:O-antigen ligase